MKFLKKYLIFKIKNCFLGKNLINRIKLNNKILILLI